MPYGVVVLLLELELTIGLQGTLGLFQKGQMIALLHSHKEVRLFLLCYFLEPANVQFYFSLQTLRQFRLKQNYVIFKLFFVVLFEIFGS